MNWYFELELPRRIKLSTTHPILIVCLFVCLFVFIYLRLVCTLRLIFILPQMYCPKMCAMYQTNLRGRSPFLSKYFLSF